MIDRRTGWLLYDSSRERAATGERNPLCSDRTLVFRSDEFSVDLVLHQGGADLVYLHGQVVRGVPGRPVQGARVRLRPESEPVSTDEHGQFCLSMLADTGQEELVVEDGSREVVCSIPAAPRKEAC